MGRLLLFSTPLFLAAIAIGLMASPVMAEVCDKVLGEERSAWPIQPVCGRTAGARCVV